MWNDLRNIIKETRERSMLSQTDLASMIGKEQSYIYCVENGQIKLSEDIVNEIVNALNIDLRFELYHRNRNEFEQKINVNVQNDDYVRVNYANENTDNLYTQKIERKTERTQLMLRPSTKSAVLEYAEKNSTSMNDVLESLASSYIVARKKGERFCEYSGIKFNPDMNHFIKNGETKSVRVQLLLKETTKNGLKIIADETGTSINSIIHKVLDCFLWEWYREQ